MHLPSLPPLIEEDLVRVNELMRQRLNTEVALIAFAAQMLVHSQASRPRPALVMLVGRALGGDAERLRMLAGAVEFIHTSLQLHHELDGAPSEDTAPRAFGGNASHVLLGDLLYTGAFRLLVDLGDMRVLRLLSDATNVIAEGSVMYQQALGGPDLGWADCRRILQARSATLFEAGARCAAVLCGADATTEDALALYGRHLGMAHQWAVESQLGAGALTLPGRGAALDEQAAQDLAAARAALPQLAAAELRAALLAWASPNTAA